jgi:hypothetical protein
MLISIAPQFVVLIRGYAMRQPSAIDKLRSSAAGFID